MLSVLCDLTADVLLDLSLENSLGSSSLQVEVEWREAPGTEMMSAVMRDIAWLEQNICTVVGVAGALAVCLILVIQVTIICRHRRHGCKSFHSDKIGS